MTDQQFNVDNFADGCHEPDELREIARSMGITGYTA